MTDFLHSPLPDEEDEKLLDEFDLGEAFADPEPRFQLSDGDEGSGTGRVLLVCVIVSLLIHFGLAVAIPRFIGVPKQQSSLGPDDNVIRVRPVELPPPEKPEPEPENTSAISDHNHRTEKERIPAMPADKGPLGTPQHMASLTPPPAPEVAKPVEEPKPKPETKTQEQPEKKIGKPKPKPKPSPQDVSQKPRSEQPKPVARNPRPSNTKPTQLADLAPRPDDYRTAFGPPGGGVQDFDPRGDPDEAVVDLNAREDNKYYSYLLYLKEKIQGVWVYPRAAAQAGTEGNLLIEFSIAKNGELLFTNLLSSSGHTVLDESALNAIRTAAPYRPLPERLHAKRLRIRANFIYVSRKFLGRL